MGNEAFWTPEALRPLAGWKVRARGVRSTPVPVVERIPREPPKLEVQVQVLAGAKEVLSAEC